MSPPIVADTGGLLRGLASTRDGQPSFPEYEKILTSASLVIVPGLVLAEVDYFLRENRVAMRKNTSCRYPPTLSAPLNSTPDSGSSIWGLVDGTVVAVAERRHIYRVLTTDRRDFAAIRVGPRLTRALELLPWRRWN